MIERAQRQRLSLRMVDDDHRLHESLDTLLSDFDTFLTRCSALLHASTVAYSRR